MGLDRRRQETGQAAAKYLHSRFPEIFNAGIHSGSRRAVETAQLLGLTDIEWMKDGRLRDGDWDGPTPREFELWTDMYARISTVCKDWDTQSINENRIVVSHGGTMHMVRAYREGFVGSKFHLLFEEPYKYFTNCQIIIYTNENPDSQVVEPDKLWVKSVCLWNLERFGHDWIQVR
jgi:broad specificity phosphatase PhoE